MGGTPERNKNSNTNIGEMTFGEVFVNVISLKYSGMLYINVSEMCFIPMNVYNELFNGVRQLRWQQLSAVVSTFSSGMATVPHPARTFGYISDKLKNRLCSMPKSTKSITAFRYFHLRQHRDFGLSTSYLARVNLRVHAIFTIHWQAWIHICVHHTPTYHR